MSISKKKTILFVLSRGETIRNFVYTGIIKKLAINNDIVLLSVFPSESVVSVLKNLDCELIELKNFKKNYAFGLLRDLFNISHGFVLNSVAAKERRKIRRKESDTFNKIIKHYLRHFIGKIMANSIGFHLFKCLEKTFAKLNNGYSYYLNLLSDIKPSLVFNGSHVHSENSAFVIHAAKALNIPTGTFLFSWDNLTSQGRMIPTYDYYFCWNKSIKSDLIKIYGNIKEENVLVTGTPQFQFHFDNDNYLSKDVFCEKYRLDPNRPIIFYSSAQPGSSPGEEIIVERLADILKEIESPKAPQLVVRVYPKDTSDRFQYLKKTRDDIAFPIIPWEKNYQTPLIEDTKLLVNMIKHCDVGVNIASTISIELFFYDKPVINIGYNPPNNIKVKMDFMKYYSFDHYKPLVDCNSVTLARKETEIKKLIIDALNHPEKNSVNRKNFLKKFFDDKKIENFSNDFIDNFNNLIKYQIK